MRWVAGLVLVALGLVGLVLPVIPGIALIALGLAAMGGKLAWPGDPPMRPGGHRGSHRDAPLADPSGQASSSSPSSPDEGATPL